MACKKNCFAYRENKEGKPYCNALVEIKCENCVFYKDKDYELANMFYENNVSREDKKF